MDVVRFIYLSQHRSASVLFGNDVFYIPQTTLMSTLNICVNQSMVCDLCMCGIGQKIYCELNAFKFYFIDKLLFYSRLFEFRPKNINRSR